MIEEEYRANLLLDNLPVKRRTTPPSIASLDHVPRSRPPIVSPDRAPVLASPSKKK